MKQFKEFGIKAESPAYIGDKIKIKHLFNKEITVYKYKIEDSNYEGKGKRLCMQIEVDGVMRIVFTGSKTLQEMIQKADDFPFTTTIIDNNERYEFT